MSEDEYSAFIGKKATKAAAPAKEPVSDLMKEYVSTKKKQVAEPADISDMMKTYLENSKTR